MNPVLARELRERFRRRRAGVFVTAWLLGLAAFGYLIYLGATSFAQAVGRDFIEPGFGGFTVLASASVGRNMFELTTFLLLSAVLLVVPGVASLAVVGEKERLTLPLLQVSQLAPGSIVLGKLASSLAYLVILVVAAAPILVLPSIFGGVTLWNSMAALFAIFLIAFTVGSLSIWSSAKAKSTRGAVAGSYLWVFLLTVVSLMLLLGEVLLFQPTEFEAFPQGGREVVSAWVNPYIGTVALIDELGSGDVNSFIPDTAFEPIQSLLRARQTGDSGLFFDQVNEPDRNRAPLGVLFMLVYVALSAFALWRAALAVTVPVARHRVFRRRAGAAT